MSNLQKIVVLCVIVVAVGGGVYFLSSNNPTPDTNNETPITNQAPENEDVDIANQQIINAEIGKTGGIVVYGLDGKALDTLTPFEGNPGTVNLFLDISPNKRFLFYGWTKGDGGRGQIYDVRNKVSHEIEYIISSIKPASWLEDNRLEIYVGCVESECTRYLSINSVEPWVLNISKVDHGALSTNKCQLEPDPGFCEARIPKYHFNQKKNMCEKFFWGGCGGVVPFDSLELCEQACN